MKAFLLCLLLAGPAAGQNILLKDGKTVVTKGLNRQGDSIIAKVELPSPEPGGAPSIGEVGYPLSQIAKLDFPEPGALHTSTELMGQMKPAEALAQLEPVVRYYEGLRDAPGSWWPQAALLQAQALSLLGRQQESDTVAETIVRSNVDAETTRAARVQQALAQVRKGGFKPALLVAEEALKESKAAWTRAAAAVIKGQCLLEEKRWDDALLAFLQVPVFYPTERQFLPPSMLGESRAHFGMDELEAARSPLEELRKTYAASNEAKTAEADLRKIAQREKALAPPE